MSTLSPQEILDNIETAKQIRKRQLAKQDKHHQERRRRNMNRVGLVVGHGPTKDTGVDAYNKSRTELDFNRMLRKEICKIASPEQASMFVQIDRKLENIPPYSEVNRLGCCCAIEMHCNGSNGEGHGTEIIHGPSEGSRRLAIEMHSALLKALGRRDRGIKPPVNGRGGAFLSRTKCPAIIAEPFFFDNEEDFKACTTAPAIASIAKAYLSTIVWAYHHLNS